MKNSDMNCGAEYNLLNKSKPYDSEVDSDEGLCFLSKLENDLQCIFDYLCNKFSNKDTHIRCRNILKKGSIFQNGDYFLSLRCNQVFFLQGVQEELLHQLKAVPYILESVIDDSGNLILSLNRTVLFKNVLKDVMRYEDKYGMSMANESYLILVHNEVFSDFDSLRLALIANNVISFLVAIGAKVSVSEFRKNPELLYKAVPTYACTETCLQDIEATCELIKNSSNSCGYHGNEWISIVEDQKSINVDFKKFAKYHSLAYWKDVDDITIIKDKPNTVVSQGAFTLHFNFCHKIKPDRIVHICLQNEKRKIIESGILIEMLKLIDASQSYIICQNIHSKTEYEVTVDEYINFQKREIEKAMKEKYSSDMLKNEKWDMYFKNLVDTSLKFSFLRASTNDPLKLDMYLNQKITSKSKDGIFIQYNFARLSNIFKKFELKVKEGEYAELPSLDCIDFGLLKFEEEWNLLNFVLSFPRLVQEIYLSINSKCFFPVNKLQIMLTELCHCFSKYYSRIHILGGPQSQLQKIMHARLWLLKGVLQILQNSFILLNIEGLDEM